MSLREVAGRLTERLKRTDAKVMHIIPTNLLIGWQNIFDEVINIVCDCNGLICCHHDCGNIAAFVIHGISTCYACMRSPHELSGKRHECLDCFDYRLSFRL